MTRDGWTRMPLGEFVTLQRGHDLPSEKRRPGRVPILGSFGITGWHDEIKARGPGVTVGRSGASFGVASYSPVDYWPLNTALYAIDFHGNDERFAYYFLKIFDFQSYNSGSAQPSLNRNLIHPVLIDVPPLAEQRAISHILGTLEDKIELNSKMNETLDAIALTLFKCWFVDFKPVTAKGEDRMPGLSMAVSDLFPDSFQDSDLGEIPKGWRTQPLSDLLSLDKGLSYKGEFLTALGVPMVNLGCFLGRGRFAREAIKNYSGDYQSRHVVRPRDLVLANTDITQRREVIGSPALVPTVAHLGEFIFTHHVFAARFHPGKEPWKLFVYFLLLQEDFRERATGFATGTTVLALPRDAVLGLRCLAPPSTVVAAFSQAAWPLVERQWMNSAESQTLVALRDALLPKLVSGELPIKDAERFIGEST
jgi:type I restriction enzyme S subunit